MAVAVCGVHASALPVDTYASSSVLASGRWVKVSVEEDGVYFISTSQLRQWGFTNPDAVNVYGYGGRRLPDVLDESYIDDLPQVQCVRTSAGLYFYGQGPVALRMRTQYFAPQPNPFSTLGYYYLSDRETTARTIADSKIDLAGDGGFEPATSFTDVKWHEVESVSPGEIGHLLVGEDFKYNRNQTFTLNLDGRVPDTTVFLESSFVTNTPSGGGYINYTINGAQLERYDDEDEISPVTDTYTHATETLTRKDFELEGSTTRVAVGVRPVIPGAVDMANLNYISLAYSRHLQMGSDGVLVFDMSQNACRLSGVSSSTHILNVTDPLEVTRVRPQSLSGAAVWNLTNLSATNYSNRYVAFNEGATGLKTPVFAGVVANQDLHSLPLADMIIITVDDWNAEAERLADLHRNGDEQLAVTVINQSLIYNEFGSGSADVNALRKMLKMFYDRSKAAGEGEPQLRYVLLMGRATSDNRRLTFNGRALNYTPMPTWLSDSGLNDNSSYTTDDIFAFLEDGSGRSFSSDKLSVAVGRLPVKSVTEARNAVNKIYNYVNSPRPGDWRNRALLVADDEDYGIHMKQAEAMVECMYNTLGGHDMFYDKLYIDAYVKQNGTYPAARSDLFRKLDEGVIWWSYNGHANPTSWTHDGLMTYTDINSLYLRYQPMIYAATCDFMRWDCAQVSGAEILFLNEGSGTIGTISATRPVYISDNGVFSQAIGRYAFSRKQDGRRYTIGEIIMNAKNNYLVNGKVVANSNKLRYVLLGDPAMRLAIPNATAVVEDINGVSPDDRDTDVIIMARQDVVVNGYVTDHLGNILTDYDGPVTYTMYDAEESVTTNANGDKGEEVTFERQGTRLLTGRGKVEGGRFALNISMPSEIADNFRTAALNLFIDGGSVDRQAATDFTNFYVYGTDYDAAGDDTAPVIETFVLNNPAFESGNSVNVSPMVMATISDNKAINMSQAGIGHQMLLTLDGKRTYTDVSNYFTPSDDGSPSGSIAYPLENLSKGEHELQLRVWDTSGNSAVSTIAFVVDERLAPKIYDIYTDANPASVDANFYLVHDRPDQMLDVTLTVYNILGSAVWSTQVTQRSDMFTSSPIHWDLTDNAGRRVRRGIYIYRATIATPGLDATDVASGRIAVTAE